MIREDKKDSYSNFNQRVLELANKISSNFNVNSVKLTITKEAPPKVSIIPFKKSKIATLSILSTDNDFVSTVEKFQGFSGSYIADCVYPVSYDKTWKDGEQTPGVCLLTLFKQKKGLDYDTFIDRWHNSHTPLSLRLHPLWNYTRNVVTKQLTANQTAWDGIVEEQFRTTSDLLNPFRFFGNPMVILYNMLLVYTDTKSFLDYKSIEPYYAVEYHILSDKT